VPTRPGPTVQRRRLGIELRRLREAAGKTIDEVAQILECSDSKVSRIENGQVSASPRDVRDMLEFYRVDTERRDELVEFARKARKKGWWEAYSDTPAVPVVGLEVAADRILAYEAMVVHGLLQTQDYAEALIRALQPDLSEEQVGRWVELRMIRQELLGSSNPPELRLILEECVLRRPVGGPQTMRAQLQHLRDVVASKPSLTMQVLPLSAGEHAAMDGAFAVYSFHEQADPDVVYFEHTAFERATNDHYLESPEIVERYSAAFERLRAAALSPDESSRLLTRLAEEI
jgi:transcriptional regulator with XRE-family HTH domain